MAVAGKSGLIYIIGIKMSKDHSLVVSVFNLPPGHSGEVTCLSFNPVYTQVLASCSLDKTVRIWKC